MDLLSLLPIEAMRHCTCAVACLLLMAWLRFYGEFLSTVEFGHLTNANVVVRLNFILQDAVLSNEIPSNIYSVPCVPIYHIIFFPKYHLVLVLS